MTLKIKIENFEGPFDLLLHLIKKNEMDIYNIKIFDITNQYLEYIEEMKVLDLDVVSEFIVFAATLLEIKSRMLLPKSIEDEVSVDIENDPRKDLVFKLIEYKKFKQVAVYLRDLEEKAGTIFTKKPEIIEDKMAYLIQRITAGNHIYFSSLMSECSSKMEVVVTFLALLELIKLKNVTVMQEDNFTEIYLEGTDSDEKNIY